MQQNRAIITEGYTDVITMHTYGFKNTVSSSGTSLTEMQLKLLARYTKRLLLLFDGDDAGIKAAERALILALQNNFDTEILTLPGGNDPDSFLRKYGYLELIKLIENQDNSFLNFLINIHFKNKKLSASSKTLAINRILQVVAVIPDELHQNFLIDELASKLGFDNVQVNTLRSNLDKFVVKKIVNYPSEDNTKEQIKTSENVSFEDECRRLIHQFTNSEYAYFRFIFTNAETYSLNNRAISIDKFLISEVSKRLQVNLRNYKTYADLLNDLDNPEFNPHLRNIIRTLSLDNLKSSENWLKFNKNETEININHKFKILALNLEKEYIDNKLKQISEKVKRLSDDVEKLALMESYKIFYERKEEVIRILSEI